MTNRQQSIDDAEESSSHLDLAGCARLLGMPRSRLWWWEKRGRFAAPAGEVRGAARWTQDDVYRWAATAPFGLAGRAPLRFWPKADEAAEFDRAYGTRGAVALRWFAGARTVAMVWTLPDVYQSRAELVAELPPTDVVLEVGLHFVADGPEVESYAPDLPERRHGMWWEEISKVLGQPAPYWPHDLRLRELLMAWRPGADAVEAPARPELDNGVLLRMAAMYEPDHPTSRILVNLARIAQRRPSDSSAQDLDIVRRTVRPNTTVVAARPTAVPDADRDDIDEQTRRIGWLEILHRRDVLAEQCIEQLKIWDNGRDLPFGNVEQIRVNSAHAREWAARLQSVPRTIAHRLLGDSAEHAETFIDPLTDAPVA
jgi:hypothetical protein